MNKPHRKTSFRNCNECTYRLTMHCFNSLSGSTCSEGHKQYSRIKMTAEELKRLREALNGQR